LPGCRKLESHGLSIFGTGQSLFYQFLGIQQVAGVGQATFAIFDHSQREGIGKRAIGLFQLGIGEFDVIVTHFLPIDICLIGRGFRQF